MKWTDTLDIAIALADTHPEVDPLSVRFTDLMNWSRGWASGQSLMTFGAFLGKHADRALTDEDGVGDAVLTLDQKRG